MFIFIFLINPNKMEEEGRELCLKDVPLPLYFIQIRIFRWYVDKPRQYHPVRAQHFGQSDERQRRIEIWLAATKKASSSRLFSFMT